MNTNSFLCIECGEVIVHDKDITCSVCYILLSEDESMYDEPKIRVYKFK
jgi:hypothetical protein